MSIYLILTVLLIFIIFFFIITQFFAHKRFNYLQETSIAIIIGLLAELFTYLFSNYFQQNQEGAQDSVRNIIMLILLPPIMFEDGYNFPRRKFFQNFRFVNLYGILGTVFNFLITWGLLHIFNMAGLFVSVSDAQESITLLNWQTLMIASALCSIEPVVTEKVIDKETYPKLFSIIFGQSLYKDTLAITLFEAIRDYVETNKFTTNFDIEGEDIGFLALRFVQVFVGSIAIGVAIGILVTIFMKNMRFLVKEKGISEVALTIFSGFLCYVLSQWAAFSGVISMLFCGTIMAHYNVYNMTEEGKVSTLIVIEILKIMACGVIFFFIGFEMFSIQSFESTIDQANKLSFSVSLLGLTFLALFIGRIANVFLVTLIGWLFSNKKKWRLNIYEVWIIFLAGLVHGAVPFALSVTMPLQTPASNCAQLNIISVVLITSLFFNMIIPKIEKTLLRKIKEMSLSDPNHPSLKQSFMLPRLNSSDRPQLSLSKKDSEVQAQKFRSTSEKYWNKFDEGIVKPFLIFNYHMRKNQIKLSKLKEREEEHQRFLKKYGRFQEEHQNILNPDNQDNVFYQISNSDNSSSGTDQRGVIKIRLSNKSCKQSEEQMKKENNLSEISHHVPQNGTERQLKQRLELSSKEYRKRGETQIVSIPLIREDKRQMSVKNIEMRIEQRPSN